jgi:hypothetical protein
VPFDNAGVRHLTDEVTASIEGRDPKQEEPTQGAGSSSFNTLDDDCRSGRLWLPGGDRRQNLGDEVLGGT